MLVGRTLESLFLYECFLVHPGVRTSQLVRKLTGDNASFMTWPHVLTQDRRLDRVTQRLAANHCDEHPPFLPDVDDLEGAAANPTDDAREDTASGATRP